jgi:KTSC domain
MPLAMNPYDEIIISGKIFNVRWINSSNVDWVAWPKEGEPLMIVKYRSGEMYGYIGVSRQRAVATAWSRSTGQYINKHIKPHFEVVKISGESNLQSSP